MKLASLKSSDQRDGKLILVNRALTQCTLASDIAPNLREALENWAEIQGRLQKRALDLENGKVETFPYDETRLMSCLPRTWLFADGSAFIYHVKLVRMARKAPLPETLTTVPLMYQAECARFLDPLEEIPQRDFAHGTDFEGEVGVITDFVPMGTTPEQALEKIRLVVLINDVSLRGLIPDELAQGFGFFQSKPSSALSPVALTVDELGTGWREGRLHFPLNVKLNGQFFGSANAGSMHFHFGHLIAHAAKTRDLQPGTLIGSGTVSNEDHSKGSSCLAEKRMIETIEQGSPKTPFMKEGDTIEISMQNEKGQDLFGRIYQKVKRVP
ncbi:MAG: fumarylacetoacetate hydrolase family protein [Bdellovibrionales bacterium]